ncbi:GNAT family N-acetyltransferase [Clostridium sp. 'deep sea']|uniref:GNAT family N-acetyltransferase n=1 Tax=Clostridium sp. 'deep sea' TaxID=2779445 RepID=UPI00189644CE|nr:GNAT family N-acetyltransferase [Clostridium sp. 'deep sea']QOR36442.1 GNAT family N-acetyltransferase [Clostridium sp. 'deep sea']
MENEIVFECRELAMADLTSDLLKNFDRFQVTTRAWYKTNDIHIINDISFTDDWDNKKKSKIVRELKKCIEHGGFVIGAYSNNTLAGFAAVEGVFFGEKNTYIELSFLHTTKDLRGYGIGSELFNLCCVKAKFMGANKLYIGAHPSVKSQKFYKRHGCVYATEINKKILKKEPLDIQLEKTL